MLDRHQTPTTPSRRVLMIAFQFPPFAMSSGVQRTLRFVQHLPAFGWQPIVLSAHPRAYADTSADLLAQVPAGTVVERAFALDTARHLAVAGRYPEWLARPDRWQSWALGAIPKGLELIRRLRPDVLWSTYPIASAHRIALQLQRLSGLPLVADFRDPMAQDGYPEDPRTWRAFDRIERGVVRAAARSVFVTPSALNLYRARYASLLAERGAKPLTAANGNEVERTDERFVLIENGYDEESFAAAQELLDPRPLNEGMITLLHSGVVYPSERDPRALFAALSHLKRAGSIDPRTLRVRFRAPVHAALLQQLADQTQTADLIEISAPIPYIEALQEMMRADGLVVMQGSNCNEQIPAKLYEYLRARRPVLGLADPRGDTGRAMHEAGIRHLAVLERADEVERALMRFVTALRRGELQPPLHSDMSRRARARSLSGLLEAVRVEHAARMA